MKIKKNGFNLQLSLKKVKFLLANYLIINLCFLLSSCSTFDYYDIAVNKARVKALKELPMLSDDEKFEIKFGKPQIFQRKILNRSQNPHISKNDVCHTWIVWILPNSNNKCVIVSGVSEARMDDWFPDTVIVRNIEEFRDLIK